jgi:acyl carrier protein
MTEYLARVKQIIALLFNIDAASLTAESSGEDIAAWDSMGQLMLILELEQQFDIRIPPERAAQLTSIAKIASYLEEST